MAIHIVAYQRRTVIDSITFRDADNSIPALAAGDKVRVKIGRSADGQTPLLDIVSGTILAGGSNVTAANPATLELTGADLVPGTIKPGTYDIEAGIIDSADSNRFKLAEQGVLSLLDTQGGGTN